MLFFVGFAIISRRDRIAKIAPQARAENPVFRDASSGPGRRLQELLDLPDIEFEKLDIVELNLAIAREIPACRDFDVARYSRTVNEWAAWVKRNSSAACNVAGWQRR
jgi:hypothetical protein